MDLPQLSGLGAYNTSLSATPAPAALTPPPGRDAGFGETLASSGGAQMQALVLALAREAPATEILADVPLEALPPPSASGASAPPSLTESLLTAFSGPQESARDTMSVATDVMRFRALLGEIN